MHMYFRPNSMLLNLFWCRCPQASVQNLCERSKQSKSVGEVVVRLMSASPNLCFTAHLLAKTARHKLHAVGRVSMQTISPELVNFVKDAELSRYCGESVMVNLPHVDLPGLPACSHPACCPPCWSMRALCVTETTDLSYLPPGNNVKHWPWKRDKLRDWLRIIHRIPEQPSGSCNLISSTWVGGLASSPKAKATGDFSFPCTMRLAD